jgi:hypothetical protein
MLMLKMKMMMMMIKTLRNWMMMNDEIKFPSLIQKKSPDDTVFE